MDGVSRFGRWGRNIVAESKNRVRRSGWKDKERRNRRNERASSIEQLEARVVFDAAPLANRVQSVLCGDFAGFFIE